jgi:type III restriction enzyme
VPRKPITQDSQNLFDITPQLRTAACVPAIRQAVADWRTSGYPGITATTKLLFNHWFNTDHRLKNGRPFKYHPFQQEALESLVYIWEVEKVRTRKELLERYTTKALLGSVPLPKYDDFARYCLKMATGSGKTKVMALAVAWQFFNAMREKPEVAKDYAKTFLLIAPNIIVLERLATDFDGGRIFRADPIIPKPLEIFWDMQVVMKGDGERASTDGTLFVTNIQQLYSSDKPEDEPFNPLDDLLGPTPSKEMSQETSFAERIAGLQNNLIVLNDEAHHTWDEDSEWNKVIRDLNARTPLVTQLDLSATPRFQKGTLFPWVIFDYPLKQAILDNIVKRPVKGVTKAQEAKSEIASVKYQAYLTAGVERWKEYKEQLQPLKKKPVLFIMLNSTAEADEVCDWLKTKYPSEFGGEKTLVIHTNKAGEISQKDLDKARKVSREIDDQSSEVNAVVSVLMLREGWDVQNVTVVVGLRPYSAKANILPEQAIGRGLRLMFRGGLGYQERVDIIGNNAFLEFVEDLEKLEEVKIEEFETGKDKLEILVIQPVAEKLNYDIGFPVLSPALVRKKSLALEIASLEVSAFLHQALPLKESNSKSSAFTYEGRDIITLETLVEREYIVPDPQTSGEVIGFYSRQIAQAVKLPSQFSVIAPKVREWFESRAFGQKVDLDSPEIIKAMGSNVASYVCRDLFTKALSKLVVEEQTPEVLAPSRMLSRVEPFPWSRQIYEANKCVLNVAPCGNEFERAFAKFLDMSSDVSAMCKVPDSFGFVIEYTDGASNLRNYYPDFVAIANDGVHWLIETKGAETEEVTFKDRAATLWCENATALTGMQWRYLKVKQRDFKQLQPDSLSDLTALGI